MEWTQSTNGLGMPGDRQDRTVDPEQVSRDRPEEARRRILAVMERVNHEFRTPLNQVFGLIELLLDAELEAEQRSWAAEIQEAASSLLRRLNDVLGLTDLEAGLLDAEEQDFELAAVLERVLDGAPLVTSGHENQFIVHWNPSLPAGLRGDAWRLQRALAHLVAYLSRMVEDATIGLLVEMQERTDDVVRLRFEIRSNRPSTALPPEDERSDAEMAFAQALVKTLGGAVTGPMADSENPRIEFSLSFDLPGASGADTPSEDSVVPQLPPLDKYLGLAEDQPVECGIVESEGENLPSAMKDLRRPRRILLAEDDRMTQALTKNLLRKRGHEVQAVSNGREAVEEVKRAAFDVVLMDLDMPVLDGVSATRQIRTQGGFSLPIVAFTAHVLSEDRKRCKDAGMDGFLAKPVSSHELFQEVERWPRRSDA